MGHMLICCSMACLILLQVLRWATPHSMPWCSVTATRMGRCTSMTSYTAWHAWGPCLVSPLPACISPYTMIQWDCHCVAALSLCHCFVTVSHSVTLSLLCRCTALSRCLCFVTLVTVSPLCHCVSACHCLPLLCHGVSALLLLSLCLRFVTVSVLVTVCHFFVTVSLLVCCHCSVIVSLFCHCVTALSLCLCTCRYLPWDEGGQQGGVHSGWGLSPFSTTSIRCSACSAGILQLVVALGKMFLKNVNAITALALLSPFVFLFMDIHYVWVCGQPPLSWANWLTCKHIMNSRCVPHQL